jgi:Flp pilus assembly protein TadG
MAKVIFSAKQISAGHRGAVAIVVVILMFMFLGFAAFAVDFGYSYMVKNELQNAADAAALAGASVLFSSNELCTHSDRPYDCCTGLKTGTCDSNVVDSSNVVGTAQAVAAQNRSGGNQVPAPTVEIGHYTFAASRDTPGTFTATQTYQQMQNWETLPFSTLNGRTDFLNAVKATVTRTNVPRFFSRIWSSSSLAVTAQAVAYIGFAATLVPFEVDQPIAICEGAIKDGNHYTCNQGTMLNQNTQTARWTDYVQGISCGTASDNIVKPLVCAGGNPTPIVFGQGLETTNGTQANSMGAIYDCWINSAKYDSDGDGVPDKLLDTDGDGKPDRPWKLTLPVVDCSATGNCLTVVGAVEVNVVWINNMNNGNPATGPKPWVPNSMYNPNTNTTWSRSSSGCGSETDCWNSFRTAFNLKNHDLSDNAAWEQKSLYFLPDCNVHAPSGKTGGENFGILARYPVLVPYREVPN